MSLWMRQMKNEGIMIWDSEPGICREFRVLILVNYEFWSPKDGNIDCV
jgi:hypothetical protein